MTFVMNDNAVTFLRTLKSYCSWRKPWLWLLVLLAVYSLGLGVIAPGVLERQLQSLARERLQAELAVGDISLNPFTLELRIKELNLRGGVLEQPLGFAELHVNLQTSSLWHRTWRFREVKLLRLFGECRGGTPTGICGYNSAQISFAQISF